METAVVCGLPVVPSWSLAIHIWFCDGDGREKGKEILSLHLQQNRVIDHLALLFDKGRLCFSDFFSHQFSNAQSFDLSWNICVTEKRLLLLRCRLESPFSHWSAGARSYTVGAGPFRLVSPAHHRTQKVECVQEWRVDWSIDQEWRYFFLSSFLLFWYELNDFHLSTYSPPHRKNRIEKTLFDDWFEKRPCVCVVLCCAAAAGWAGECMSSGQSLLMIGTWGPKWSVGLKSVHKSSWLVGHVHSARERERERPAVKIPVWPHHTYTYI